MMRYWLWLGLLVAGPAVADVLVYDTFTGTDGAEWSAHTPDTDAEGGGWQIVNGCEADACEISGNRLRVSNAFNVGLIDSGQTAYTIWTTWDTVQRNVHIYFRSDGTNPTPGVGTGDAWRLEIDNQEINEVRLRRIDNGAATTVDSATHDALTGNHLIKIVVTATTITVSIDGTEYVSATDATYAANTYVGLGEGAGTGSDYIDDFLVATPAAACAPVDVGAADGSTANAYKVVPCSNAPFPDLVLTENEQMTERYMPYYLYGCHPLATSPVWSGSLPTGMSVNSSGEFSGSAAAGSYPASVTCTNAQGAATHHFWITVASAAVAGTMKWNPGAYLMARQQESQYESGDNATRAAHYDIIEGSPGIEGVGTYGAWSSFESSEGVYDFSGLLADIAAAKARGLRYWLRLDDRTQSNLPAYIWSGECRLGTTNQWRIWNTTCRGYFKNMLTALCAAVESEPYFEGFSLPKESALGSSESSQDGTYSLAGYAAGLQDIASHARAQCPTTNVVLNVNSFSGGSAQQTIEDLVDWGVLNGVGHGAPDTAPQCVGDDPNPCTYETAANQDQMHYKVIADPANRYAGDIPIAMGMEPSELGTGAVGESPAYLPSTLHDYAVNHLGASHMLVVRNVVCSGACATEYGEATKWLGTGGDGQTDGILWFYNNEASWPNDACPADYVSNRGGCITGDE